MNSKYRETQYEVKAAETELKLVDQAEGLAKRINQNVIKSGENKEESAQEYAESKVRKPVEAGINVSAKVVREELIDPIVFDQGKERPSQISQPGLYEEHPDIGNKIISEKVDISDWSGSAESLQVSDKHRKSSSQTIPENEYFHEKVQHSANLADSRFRSLDNSIRFSEDSTKKFIGNGSGIGKIRKSSYPTVEETGKSSVISAGEAEKTAVESARRSSAAVGKASSSAGKAGSNTVAETTGESAASNNWMFWVILAAVIFIMTVVANVAGAILTGQMDEEARPVYEVIAEINGEFNDRIKELRNARDYDTVTMIGSRARWQDVLAVYFAKTMDDLEGGLSFYYISESGADKLRDIFWDMNDIDSDVTRQRVKELVRTENEDGNIVYEPHWVTQWELTITIAAQSAYEMSERPLYMTGSQKELLYEFLSEDYDELWPRLVYGYYPEDCPIIAVSLQEVGNIGGEKYWRWYGFGSHVDWCACFVSWCANECGYIEQGIVPKYARCVNGAQWFQEHGQWLNQNEEPAPGMIIFFDWDHPDGRSGPQDGRADHTGIVERVEDGIIYTIEGNAWDVCMQNQYPVGWYEILGYGTYSTGRE